MNIFDASFAAQLGEQLELLAGDEKLFDEGRYIQGKSIAVRAGVIIDMMKSPQGGNFIKSKDISFTTPINPGISRGKNGENLAYYTIVLDQDHSERDRIHRPAFKVEGQDWYNLPLGKWLFQKIF